MHKIKRIPKKYYVKIPTNNTILYAKKKQTVIVSGPLGKRLLKLKLKIIFSKKNNLIKISSLSFFQMSNNERKNVRVVQGTLTALFKQLLAETSVVLSRKLKFIGVGYRAFLVNDFEKKLLLLKLGYSHFIYYKIIPELKMFCLKFTKLFIFGNFYQTISQTASSIRLCKKPEPYKGKGILHYNEKIELKEGKRI